MQLVVQTGPDAGKVVNLDSPLLVVGRQAGVDLLLNDGQISRRHVQFEIGNGQVFISDLGSANGTFVNGQRLTANQPRSVSSGDLVRLGSTTLAVQGTVNLYPGSAQPQSQNLPPLYNRPTQPPAPAYPPAPTPPAYNAPPSAPPAYNAPYQPAQYNMPPASYPAPAQNMPPYNANPAQFQNPYPIAPPPGPVYGTPHPATPNYVIPTPGKATPTRKSFLVPGMVGLLLFGALLIGLIAIVGGSTGRTATNNISGVGGGNSLGTGTLTAAPLPTITIARGTSGTNPPPPSPGAAASGSALANMTVNAGRPGGIGVNLAQGEGQTVTRDRLKATFPASWTVETDNPQYLMAAVAPDGTTVALVQQADNLSGNATERLNQLLETYKRNFSDIKIIDKVSATNDGHATAYIQYTDKSKTHRHEYIRSIPDGDKNTYLVRFSAEAEVFDNLVDTFNTILGSIIIS